MLDDTVGHAAEQQFAKTGASVRSHNDEIRTPPLCVGDDPAARVSAHVLDRHGFRVDLGRFGRDDRGRDDLLRRFTGRCLVGAVVHVLGPQPRGRQHIDDMDHPDLR